MFHHTRIRLAATAAAAVAAIGLTACGTGSGSGDEIVDKPKANASAKADSGKEKEPAAEKSSAAPDVAKVGDTLALKGMESGSGLDVTVVKVVDNAKSGDEFFAPEDGNRWIGVQFQLVNTGTKVYSDAPDNSAKMTDDQGQQFGTTLAEISAGPSMSSDVRLKPGAKALGWVVFEVPKASKAATVTFAMDSGFAQQVGEWKL
ncbi:DUF4352 domain-containing protein [Streptomyces cyaneochromogenes]|uniref:DUF4352 domain-containing protein n=1 Tax=Streptomyces cyaneochromogenes TaxID=2496836 RepID=A0A3Q9ET97_9ACTN|nr:DUF4352 domain-containing protein [Streptomyces cyaneochromogenes]AZQ38729.1 DUF4352 domain-containing protein [Streptomyces cyaneochromogenes]